jgi:prepilin-type N-terminal cleavage/methylation domain-containing protein
MVTLIGSQKSTHTPRGFTIVELLLVIVVIAILSTISVVAYNGVTQRADNDRRISVARQVQMLIKSYILKYGVNPADVNGSTQSGGVCLTVDNNCTDYSGTKVTSSNTSLITELNKIGVTPSTTDAKVSNSSMSYWGLYLDYNSFRTYNGVKAPYLMMFWLKGDNQKCALTDTVMHDLSLPDVQPTAQNGWVGSNPFVTSTKGYTYSSDDDPSDAGITECYVSL